MSIWAELQGEIYRALQMPLSAEGFGLYDDVPELPAGMPDDAFPYVQIGDMSASAFDNDDTVGHEVFIAFHIWAKSTATSSARALIYSGWDVVFETLNRKTFAMPQLWHLDTLPAGEFTTVRESDNVISHGVGRFRFTVQRKV
jgi:hypothetical protein